MSVIHISQKPRRVKQDTDTTPEQRAARVEAFKHITQEHYDHLLKIVRLVVPEYLCDPEEAFSQGMLAATRMYNGSTCLSTYVTKCAMNYAIRMSKKAKRQIQFADLPGNDHDQDENAAAYIDEIIGADDEMPYLEGIDDQFIERVNEILAEIANSAKRSTRHKVVELAEEILDELRIAANLGNGIGVDEYDNAPLKAPEYDHQAKVYRNTLEPRSRIIDHLADTIGASRINVVYAMIALRNCTRQALCEGWLPT